MQANKKYLNLILISAATVVWLVIFFQIIRKDNDEALPVAARTDVRERPAAKNHGDSIYQSSREKDPFITPFNVKKRKPVKNKKTKTEPRNIIQPELKYLGMIIDENGKLAIIRFPDSDVKFARENQEIKKIKIISIENKELKFSYLGKAFTIHP